MRADVITSCSAVLFPLRCSFSPTERLIPQILKTRELSSRLRLTNWSGDFTIQAGPCTSPGFPANSRPPRLFFVGVVEFVFLGKGYRHAQKWFFKLQRSHWAMPYSLGNHNG